MQNVLPQQAGLTVNNVIYSYTTIKEESDAMLVHVQNENAIDGGYIFRSTDDWTGIPGNTINKVVAVGDIPIDYWGDGEIVWEGDGKVTDPKVVYTYRYDTCFDPQTDPSCPGFKPEIPDIPNVEVVDPLDDDMLQNELDREMTMRDEDQEEQERKQVAEEEEEEDSVDLESILGTVDRSLQNALDTQRHNQLSAMSNFSQGYYAQIPDTVYNDTVELKDASLPINRRGRRLQFAQDLLHEKMIKSQYRGEQ